MECVGLWVCLKRFLGGRDCLAEAVYLHEFTSQIQPVLFAFRIEFCCLAEGINGSIRLAQARFCDPHRGPSRISERSGKLWHAYEHLALRRRFLIFASH